MRNLSATVLAKVAQQYASEPVNIVEIQWNKDSGNFLKYSDKELDLGDEILDGRVLEISSLESVLKLDSQNISQSISVKLSDADGDLKTIFDGLDIHGSLCKVSQWFPGLSINDRFDLFQGEINSPITWDEGDRTLSFDVITRLADKEAGFSPEEGSFNHIPENLIGVPWPMVFGFCQNVPATRLQEVPTTQTAEDLLIIDPTLVPRMLELVRIINELSALITFYGTASAQAQHSCADGDQQACAIVEQMNSIIQQLTQQHFAARQELLDISSVYNEQRLAASDSVELLDEKNLPQGTTIILDVEGEVELNGTLNGSTFTINEAILPNWDGSLTSPYGATWLGGGSTVRIKTEKAMTYIANILPTTVRYITAYKRIGNTQALVIVPASWYTVSQVNLGTFTVTAIVFSKPLSSFDEDFEDEIYVTQVSSVGPNTVDEMIWLIDTFSDLNYDATSFNYVKTMIENYPSHFAMLERKNLLVMLEEIAFQARCAIWINNNTVFLKYLSEELAADGTVTEDDIDVGSLQIYGTDTEELVTKLVATWTDNYAIEDMNKIILRHNIKKYGTRERAIEFYIYNIGELVLKSATFWLIRLANVWKNVTFRTSLQMLNLETFDTVDLNFTESYVATASVKGLVKELKYESSDRTLLFDVWTPVKFGTMDSYVFGWPSQIDPSNFFPTDQEIALGYAGGDGPGAEVEGGFTIGDDEVQSNFVASTSGGQRRTREDYGDTQPSDLDDTKPEPKFLGSVATPGTEPTWSYDYGEYNLNVPPLDTTESADEESWVFPAEVTGFDETIGAYQANVYEKGFIADPVAIPAVTQLQIADDERIPNGTWALVAKNKIGTDAETGAEIFEYTMQVPVWL